MNDLIAVELTNTTSAGELDRGPVSVLEAQIREVRNELRRRMPKMQSEFVSAEAKSVHDLHKMLKALWGDFVIVKYDLDLPNAINRSFRKAVAALHALASELDIWAKDLAYEATAAETDDEADDEADVAETDDEADDEADVAETDDEANVAETDD